MTPGMRALLVVVSVGIVIAAWTTRFQVIRADELAVFRIDRWTGSVSWCHSGFATCSKVPSVTATPVSTPSN